MSDSALPAALHSMLFYPAGTLCLAAAAGLDALLGAHPFLAEGLPVWSSAEVGVSTLTALGCALLVTGMVRAGSGTVGDGSVSRGWGVLSWHGDEGAGSPELSLQVKALAVWSILLVATGSLLIFLDSPARFKRLGMEDNVVETVSALILLMAAALIAFRCWHPPRLSGSGTERLLGAGLALGVFVIAMEEISWFQRYAGIETPEMFAANMQNEMNLHNFASDFSELLYYNGAFAGLILIPFLLSTVARGLWQVPLVAAYAPGRLVLFAGAPFVAFDYDTWPVWIAQVAFFTTVFVLLHEVLLTRRQNDSVALPLSLLAFLVIAQGLFLLLGERFKRDWDVTEYKELLIPLAILVYSAEIHLRSPRRLQRREKDPRSPA